VIIHLKKLGNIIFIIGIKFKKIKDMSLLFLSLQYLAGEEEALLSPKKFFKEFIILRQK